MVREALARVVLSRRAHVRRWPGPAAAPTGGPRTDAAGLIGVAAVQMQIRAQRSGDAFAAQVGALCERAARLGAGLVVFPEDTATGLLGMLPGFERLAGRGPAGVAVADVLAFAGPYIERVYRPVFSRLAARHRITIVAGTALLPTRGRVENLCHVFGPDGGLVGVQPKLHLFPFEAEWGIAPGDDLRVFATPAGRLVAPVCMDATYFETFRIARALGAELAAVPTADPDAYSREKKMRGAWARAQESGMYVINACLFGEFAGLTITGRSAVYAPLPLTSDGSGVLAEVADRDREGVVVARCDLGALRRVAVPEAPAALLAELGRAYARLARGGRGAGRADPVPAGAPPPGPPRSPSGPTDPPRETE